jgi:uncharacterized protein YodC (DUF2158 family)
MEAKYKEGDQVRFILGGPLMVIIGIHDSTTDLKSKVDCVWFDSAGACHEHRLDARLVKPDGDNVFKP